jgi:hypothetical protein
MPTLSKPCVMVAAASLLATATAAQAAVTTTFNGTYTAYASTKGTYSPTINDDGGAFMNSPFSRTLMTGTPVTSIFMQVAPSGGGSNVGTITGSIAIAMTLTGPGGSAVTGVTTSAGGNGATLSHGTIDFSANYELFYGNQTDCLTWNAPSCNATGNTSTVGETLTVTFADKAVLNINLYNWSDWNMQPEIGFDLISAPVAAVPEPPSVAQFGVGLIGIIGLTMLRRRSRGGAPDSGFP